MIIIVDYEMGNIGSVVNMIKKVGGSTEVTSDSRQTLKACKLIPPGVRAFENSDVT